MMTVTKQLIDEEYDDLNELCTVGIGRCERTGLLRCTRSARDGEDNGRRRECGAKQQGRTPLEEVCNGADDDCDGETDDRRRPFPGASERHVQLELAPA